MELNLLPTNADPQQILEVFQNWMNTYSDCFDSPPFTDYKLKNKIQLNIAEYPVEYLELQNEGFTY